MPETGERRRVARITVPRHLSGPELDFGLVRVLDLSPLGARVEHFEPFREGVVCFVELPPTLGGMRLTGRVVWTMLRWGEQTFEGQRRLHYQSGLAFIGLTPEQQGGLATALAVLRTASDTTDFEPPS